MSTATAPATITTIRIIMAIIHIDLYGTEAKLNNELQGLAEKVLAIISIKKFHKSLPETTKHTKLCQTF